MKHLRARCDEAISCSGRISSSLVVGLISQHCKRLQFSTPALGTKNPLRSNSERVFLFGSVLTVLLS